MSKLRVKLETLHAQLEDPVHESCRQTIVSLRRIIVSAETANVDKIKAAQALKQYLEVYIELTALLAEPPDENAHGDDDGEDPADRQQRLPMFGDPPSPSAN